MQVIQGHSDDLERMASLARSQDEVLAREAPHILGVTVAEHADRPGDFTQILYFTSEQDARSYDQDPAIEEDEPPRRTTRPDDQPALLRPARPADAQPIRRTNALAVGRSRPAQPPSGSGRGMNMNGLLTVLVGDRRASWAEWGREAMAQADTAC